MRGWSDSIQALTTASNADILSPHCSLSKPLNLYTLISFQMSENSSSRCATHTQRRFFRSQTLLYHPHPHFSIFSHPFSHTNSLLHHTSNWKIFHNKKVKPGLSNSRPALLVGITIPPKKEVGLSARASPEPTN